MNRVIDILTGKKPPAEPLRTPRDKFVVVPAEVPATIPQQALEPTPKKEKPMATKNTLSYIKGAGKAVGDKKAEFKLGQASVPAAVVSRIIKEVKSKPEARKSFIIYNMLEKKYGTFLEALDAAGLDYVEALNQMEGLKPKASGGTGLRAGKTEKTAEALAKAVCKRFKGTPDAMVKAFEEMVKKPDFQKELSDIITNYQQRFGTRPAKKGIGYTKTSSRKGNPKAIKALAAARAKKAGKK